MGIFNPELKHRMQCFPLCFTSGPLPSLLHADPCCHADPCRNLCQRAKPQRHQFCPRSACEAATPSHLSLTRPTAWWGTAASRTTTHVALVHERLEEALARCIQLVLPMVLQAHVAALAILRLPLKLHKISLQEGNLGNTPAVTAPTDSAWRRPRARRAVIVRRVEHGPLVRDPTGCPPAEKA